MPASTYLAGKLLRHTLSGQSYPPPSGYIALFYSNNNADGGGTEVSTLGTGYARQPCTFGGSDGATSVTLTSAVNFPTALTAYAQPVTSWAVMDTAGNGGNVLVFDVFDEPRTVTQGDSITLTPGSIAVTFRTTNQ